MLELLGSEWRRLMVDDGSPDGHDSLRLQNLGGGVSCFYYTDLRYDRLPGKPAW